MSAVGDRLKSLPCGCFRKTWGSAHLINWPDWEGVLRGRAVYIEEKRPGEAARPGQLAVLRRLAACGAVTGVARSAEDVDAILAEHGWDGEGWSAGA